MEDAQIVRLYFNRDESAIAETAAKYGDYCHSIAYGILRDAGDSEESVSDTWLGAWNSIPPHCPAGLAGFLGKITRRVSIDRLRRRGAEKRGGGELPLALEELERCIPGGGSAE